MPVHNKKPIYGCDHRSVLLFYEHPAIFTAGLFLFGFNCVTIETNESLYGRKS